MLNEIQVRLNAPKNQFNSFGKYNYRSTEDILEGLKPLLKEFEACVILSDKIELIGDRYYVKATASLHDKDGVLIAENNAYAREELTQKGMTSAQITGGTSSYARKYALNGLFAIDDTKDDDSRDNSNETQEAAGPKLISPAQLKLLNTLMSNKKVDRDAMKAHYKIESFKQFQLAWFDAFKKYLDDLPQGGQ